MCKKSRQNYFKTMAVDDYLLTSTYPPFSLPQTSSMIKPKCPLSPLFFLFTALPQHPIMVEFTLSHAMSTMLWIAIGFGGGDK